MVRKLDLHGTTLAILHHNKLNEMWKVLDPLRFVLSGRRLDEPKSTTGDRLPSRGEPSSSGTDGGRRLRLNDDQRRRLAANAKGLGRKLLAELATIVTPETLLAWHRKLIAKKYDGSEKRGPGRPRTAGEIGALVIRMAEGEPELGVSAYSGCVVQLGTRDCPYYDRCDIATARD